MGMVWGISVTVAPKRRVWMRMEMGSAWTTAQRSSTLDRKIEMKTVEVISVIPALWIRSMI